MTRHLLLTIVLLAAAALSGGCSDQSSFVGVGLFSKDVQMDSLVIHPDSSATYRAPITGNSTTLLLGAFQTTGVRLLLQFNAPSGVADTSIVSGELKLIPRYWFKDSIGNLSFTVHKIVRAWNQSTITFDSTNGLPGPPVGSFDAIVSPSETLLVPIDTTLLREWVRTPGQAYGVILIPTPLCNVVYGFTSFVDFLTDIRPELTYRYIVADSTQRLDSVVAKSIQDAYVAGASLPAPTQASVVVQAGVADRGLLLFNVDSIPRSASITSAILEFTRDLSLSERNELSADSVFVQLLLDNENPPRGGIFAIAEPVGGESGTLFRAEVSRIVQQWVTGQPNYGFSLRAYNEFSSLDRFVFHGASDSLNGPRLNVRYSILGGSR